MPFLNKMNGSFSGDGSLVCDICQFSKQTRQPFTNVVVKSSKIFDLIHVDLWGPYKERSLSGAQYFLTIVDDHSRALWTFLLKEKTVVSELLQHFLVLIDNQFGKRVKMIKSDNGT